MRLGWALVGAVSFACVVRCACKEPPPSREPLRLATFNIEDFPKDRRQIDGAFGEIADLHSGIIAVQEIGDPELLEREAKRRLGRSWQLAHVDTRPIGETRRGHHIGVLFDGTRWQSTIVRVFDDTRLAGGRHKPVLDVRLRAASRDAGDAAEVMHVLVLHLKSGSEGRAIRHAQLGALHHIIQDVQREGRPVVVMGDFNATDEGDRDDLAMLARDLRLTWATEPLACTAFWAREDGCPRSRLDHVLTWKPPSEVHAAGACAREGCEWQASCPVYARQVSDHCPVVVTFE